MVVRRIGDRERKSPIEENVREEVNQFQQRLRHQPRHQSYQQRVNADSDHLRFQRHAELPLLVRLRFRHRSNLWNRKLSHHTPPFRAPASFSPPAALVCFSFGRVRNPAFTRRTSSWCRLRQRRQNLFTSRREGHHHLPAIRLARASPHQPVLRGALHQTHHGVVPLLQKLRQFRNRCLPVLGKSRNPQHQLMLLRRHPARPRRPLAETQKPAQVVPEPRQLPHHLGMLLLHLSHPSTPPPPIPGNPTNAAWRSILASGARR